MDYLAEAKKLVNPPATEGMEWAQVSGTLAIACALIAWVEHVRKAAEDAEAAAERADLIHERLAQREVANRIL